MQGPGTIIFIFFVCFIFFMLGFFFYPTFYQLVLPGVEGMQYNMDLDKLWDAQNLFASVFALVPLCMFIIWQVIPARSIDKKTATCFVVLICMVLAVYIRYRILVSTLTEMVAGSSNQYTGELISFPFDQLGFEFYLLGGLISGCVLSYLIFHNKIVQRTSFKGVKNSQHTILN